MDEILKKWNIELVYKHMIAWLDENGEQYDYSVGVLAEDTNYMIRHVESDNIKVGEINANLKLLKEWL